MNRQAARELRRLEQLLARRPVSAEQRRRLRPVVGALLARLAQTAARPAAVRSAARPIA